MNFKIKTKNGIQLATKGKGLVEDIIVTVDPSIIATPVLPFGQTNPDCYYGKVFSHGYSNSKITIDFTKFANWHESLTTHQQDVFWYGSGSGSGSGGEEMYAVNLCSFAYAAPYDSRYSKLYLAIYSSSINLILEVDYENVYSLNIVNYSDGKTALECLKEIGQVVVNLEDISIDGTDPFRFCMLSDIYNIPYYYTFSGYTDFNDHIEFTNSIDWLKISEND